MESKTKKRILVIDDHPLFREGLKSILGRNTDFKVAGEAGNAKDGLKAARKIEPELVCVDLSLPDQNGVELTRAIREYLPETPVMIISMHSKVDYIIQAFQAGAKGYLLKESASESLLRAIESVIKGEYFLDSALSNEVVKKLKNSPKIKENIKDAAHGGLTAREQEIMKLLAEGMPRKDMAENLSISQKTVENHITKILKKMSFQNTLELVRYAAKLGVIDIDRWKKQ